MIFVTTHISKVLLPYIFLSVLNKRVTYKKEESQIIDVKFQSLSPACKIQMQIVLNQLHHIVLKALYTALLIHPAINILIKFTEKLACCQTLRHLILIRLVILEMLYYHRRYPVSKIIIPSSPCTGNEMRFHKSIHIGRVLEHLYILTVQIVRQIIELNPCIKTSVHHQSQHNSLHSVDTQLARYITNLSFNLIEELITQMRILSLISNHLYTLQKIHTLCAHY